MARVANVQLQHERGWGASPRAADAQPLALRGHYARAVGPYLTVAFVFAGYFKGAHALSRIPIDLTLAFGLASALVCAWVVLSSGAIPRVTFSLFVPFILFVPAVFWAADTAYGSEKIVKLFTFTLLALLAPVILVRSVSDVRRFLRATFIVCAVVAVASVLTGGTDTGGSESVLRATNLSGDPISLGVAAGAVIVIATAGAASRTVRLAVAAPAIGIGSLILIYSGSRGPLAATFVAAVAIVLRARGERRVPMLIGLAFLMSVSLWYGWQSAPSQSQDRIEVFATDAGADASTVARANFARVALEESAHAPFGLGWGGFQGAAENAGFRGVEYPHNIVLEILVEAGWLAMVAFVAFVGLAVARGFGSANDFVGLGVLGLLLLGLMVSMVSGDVNDRVLIMGLGITLAHSSLGRWRHPEGRAHGTAVQAEL